MATFFNIKQQCDGIIVFSVLGCKYQRWKGKATNQIIQIVGPNPNSALLRIFVNISLLLIGEGDFKPRANQNAANQTRD